MNGEILFMSDIEDKLQEFIKQLDEFENRTGVVVSKLSPDIELYMNIESERLKNMTDEECGIAAVKLQQYATYLQKQINRQTAIKNWADTNLYAIMAAHNADYDKFIKIEMKRYLIAKENNAAVKLVGILNKASARVDDLSYLTGRIAGQAESLLALQQTKRKR